MFSTKIEAGLTSLKEESYGAVRVVKIGIGDSELPFVHSIDGWTNGARGGRKSEAAGSEVDRPPFEQAQSTIW